MIISGRARSETYGTAQRTYFSLSTLTHPQKALEGSRVSYRQLQYADLCLLTELSNCCLQNIRSLQWHCVRREDVELSAVKDVK